MGDKTQQKLSPYWRDLMVEAADILKDKIEYWEHETVDPDYCLLESDKRRMERQQSTISGLKAVLETIEKREWGAKFWAFETVLGEKPADLFHPAPV